MSHKLSNIQRLFIDANIIIYFIEKNTFFYDQVRTMFLYCIENNIEICTSEISIGECLLRNYKKNLNREKAFELYFQDRHLVSLFPISQEYLYEASKLGAQNMNLFDALHIVTVLQNAGDIFLTNDKKMKSDRFKILQLSEL